MNINPNIESPQYVNGYKNLKNYILLNLGYPLVRVELTDHHINQCIIDAITYYTKYGFDAIEYKYIIAYPNGDGTVDLPDDPDYQNMPAVPADPFNNPNPEPVTIKLKTSSIVDVIFFSTTLDRLAKALFTGGLAGGFEDYVIPLSNYVSGDSSVLDSFDITNYYLYTMKLEDFKKAVGVNQTWEILNDKIQLYPKDFRWNDPVGILYKPAITEAMAEQEMWIKNFALACAKTMLGRIRLKLSGFNSGGINIAADGESLLSEGKEEKEKLLEELKFMGPPLPFGQM